jgi:23S rRNA pseudouridine1911/1915/1917 synthase
LAHTIPHLTRSQIKKLIQQNEVLVNGHPAKPGSIVQTGEMISLTLPAPPAESVTPQPMTLKIVYEDETLIVVNKDAGIVVHPAHGHNQDTLVNGLLAAFPDLSAMTSAEPEAGLRPGIVHRLDQDTSGLIVVARTPQALQNLRRQFKARTVEKIYLALVHGHPVAPEGIIDAPLGRHPRHRQKFAVRPDGKSARTRYRLKSSFADYSLLEIALETGRTHQIRVHLAWLKCPVVGDNVYGRKRNELGLSRQFLHAWRLSFKHPRTAEQLDFEAPLPDDLRQVLSTLS